MSNLLFGAALGGVIGHFAAQEPLKYAAAGAVGGILWDFVSSHIAPHPAVRLASVPPPRPLNAAKHVTGAVNRGGYRGGAGMPFGPGPWPTQGASPPDSNMQSPDPNSARNDPDAMMAGWGDIGAAPYGRGHFQHGEWW
jgi:hypothetical protein